MFVSDCLEVNSAGHLEIGGCDTVDLAQKYGTPLYVMDENKIRNTCRKFKNSIEKYYQSNGLVCYASKAFSCIGIYQIVEEEGLGADVVSGGELFTAVKAGFPMEKVFFHGNNKTVEELTYAISVGVGTIVVDNLFELELLERIAASAGKNVKIMFRIKPGIDAHTHDFVKTGQIDSKFGFALETDEAMDAVKTAVNLKHINLIGLHCHIGSQIFDIDPFELAAKVMIQFMGEVKRQTKLILTHLNLGGGFGIKYLPEHDPEDYDHYMSRVSSVIKEYSQAEEIPLPFVIIEPGRSIVGPAGITLYKVGGIKDIPGIRTYVSIDGGMADNPRYALYKSPYDAVIANRAGEPRSSIVTIAGKCCESGDLIQENASIQKVSYGDILAVLATGAYNYSMASNYNRIPRPATVLVKGGASKLLIKRESYEDLIVNDIIL